MKPSDFDQATEAERDLLAIRFSRQVRTDDHAFTAVMARICGHGGPNLVPDTPHALKATSLHGSDGASH